MRTSLNWIINPTSKGDQRPIMLVSYSGKFVSNRFLYATGEYAKKGEWNGKGKLKQYAITGNSKLKDLGTRFTELTDQEIFDKDILKTELDKIKDPDNNPAAEEKKVFSSIVEYAENSLQGTPTYYNQARAIMLPMSKGTIKSKKQAIERLKDFEKIYKYKVTFENCDQNFWRRFLEFLTNRRLSSGSRGRIVKDVKSFLNSAIQQGYTVNQDFKKRGIAPSEKSEKKAVRLLEDEILKLADLNLSGRPDLVNSRDWLLIACGTGLRQSDLSRLNESNIINQKIIRIRTKKTGEAVDIPIGFNWLLEVFERRDWTFPKHISDQRLNTNLKVIAELAGLNRIVYARVKDYVKKTNGEKEYFTELRDVELHKVISTHIGRRTFITLMVISGIPITSIAKITGHKKLEILQAYEQMTPEEKCRLCIEKNPRKQYESQLEGIMKKQQSFLEWLDENKIVIKPSKYVPEQFDFSTKYNFRKWQLTGIFPKKEDIFYVFKNEYEEIKALTNKLNIEEETDNLCFILNYLEEIKNDIDLRNDPKKYIIQHRTDKKDIIKTKKEIFKDLGEPSIPELRANAAHKIYKYQTDKTSLCESENKKYFVIGELFIISEIDLSLSIHSTYNKEIPRSSNKYFRHIKERVQTKYFKKGGRKMEN
jgi:integrase